MTGLPPSLNRVIGLSGGALDALMPMHIWVDVTGRIVQAGPTLEKMTGRQRLRGKTLFDVVEFRRPAQARTMPNLLSEAGHRLSLALKAAPNMQLRGTLTGLPGGAGAILDISLGLSFARAVAEFGLTLNDFSPCDQPIELLYLHEANQSTARLSRHLSERLQAARAAAEAQALTDALTGLANRRAVDQELARCLADPNADFALLHIDLDLFKQVNDTFGHAAGDAVLSRVGAVLRSELRHTDFAGRVGGDEFLAIIHGGCDRDALGVLAARLIAELEEPILFEGHVCRISASIGIATVADYETRPEADMILADTDVALYRAKRGGRGRFVIHGAAEPDIPPGRRATDPAPTSDETRDGQTPLLSRSGAAGR